MISATKKTVFIWAAALFLIIAVLLAVWAVSSDSSEGILHIEPGRSYLYLKNHDLTVRGQW